jgi:predicted benzoate:H+ symporter BenE
MNPGTGGIFTASTLPVSMSLFNTTYIFICAHQALIAFAVCSGRDGVGIGGAFWGIIVATVPSVVSYLSCHP